MDPRALQNQIEALNKRIEGLMAEGNKVIQERDEARRELEAARTAVADTSENQTEGAQITVETVKAIVEGVLHGLPNTSAASGMHKFKLRNPDTYDGARSMDVKTWIFQLEKYFALARVGAGDQVEYAGSLLRGSAA